MGVGEALFIYLLIYLGAQGLSRGMWDPVSQLGIGLGPPALGMQSLSQWTTREVPDLVCF